MSQDIINEVYFFAGSILMGIIITFVYDFLLIARRVVTHNMFWVSFEDFLFWTACAISVFYLLYKENNGILRWFAVMGAAFGMLLYKKIIGGHFVYIVSAVVEKEIHIIRRIFGFLFRPLRWGMGKAGAVVGSLHKSEKKIFKYMKKKLTDFLKMLKITICKH